MWKPGCRPRLGSRRFYRSRVWVRPDSQRSPMSYLRARRGLVSLRVRPSRTASSPTSGCRSGASRPETSMSTIGGTPCLRMGISASARGASDYPIRLVDDLESPPVMYWRGRTMPDAPTAAIVGTRKCTSYGLRVAFELGAALTRAGVSVVSGLALGIDASAHLGSISVDDDGLPDGCWPVAVVGSGLDVIYPRRNRNLWTKIAERGALFSEAPPGAQPEAWRFPARNRIIAALSDAVIVVESRTQGGSLLTVDEAQLRDVPVGAVPGPILSPSSVGTNQLLADGATPILGVDDVLAMIGHVRPRPASKQAESSVSSELLETMGWAPLLFDQICALSEDSPAAVAMEVERLVTAGFCVRSGAFIERVR